MASTAGYSTASPGWETVVSGKTRSNKQINGKNGAANAAKKKFVENAPKLEDVLPMEQVASFYAFEPQLKQQMMEQKAKKTNEEDAKTKKANAKNAKKSNQEQNNAVSAKKRRNLSEMNLKLP